MLFWATSSVEGTGSERLLLALAGAVTFAVRCGGAPGPALRTSGLNSHRPPTSRLHTVFLA
jgi:hypothetical protein